MPPCRARRSQSLPRLPLPSAEEPEAAAVHRRRACALTLLSPEGSLAAAGAQQSSRSVAPSSLGGSGLDAVRALRRERSVPSQARASAPAQDLPAGSQPTAPQQTPPSTPLIEPSRPSPVHRPLRGESRCSRSVGSRGRCQDHRLSAQPPVPSELEGVVGGSVPLALEESLDLRDGELRHFEEKLKRYPAELREVNANFDALFSRFDGHPQTQRAIRAELFSMGIDIRRFDLGHIEPACRGGPDRACNLFLQERSDNQALAGQRVGRGELCAAGRLAAVMPSPDAGRLAADLPSPEQKATSAKDMRMSNRTRAYGEKHGIVKGEQEVAHKLDCDMAAKIVDSAKLTEGEAKEFRSLVNSDLNFRVKTREGNQIRDFNAECDFVNCVRDDVDFKWTNNHTRKMNQYLNFFNKLASACSGDTSSTHQKVLPALKSVIDALSEKQLASGKVAQLSAETIEGYAKFSRPCFDVDVMVHVVDPSTGAALSWQRLVDLEPGDYVELEGGAAGKVMRVTESLVGERIRMCSVGELWTTPGHPLYVAGAWVRPFQLSAPQMRYQAAVYNIWTHPEEPVVIGSGPSGATYLAATLGHATPGLVACDKEGWLQTASDRGVCDWLQRFPDFHIRLAYRGSRADFLHLQRLGHHCRFLPLHSELAARLARTRAKALQLPGLVRNEVVDDGPERDDSPASGVLVVAVSEKVLAEAARLMDANEEAEAIAAARASLPIKACQGELLRLLEARDVVVLVGETGCGKSTQVPQYLAEGDYAPVVCSQPRTIAARALAARTAAEFGAQLGDEVGYHVRFDKCTTDAAAISYVSDGTLQRQLLADSYLRRYRAVMVDEAHERSVNTDVTMALLKSASAARASEGNPLKLIITSATLDADRFSAYFDACPVVRVAGRTFPVECHYQPDPQDYLGAAVNLCMHIHETSESGDILVFLASKEEIEEAVRRCATAMRERQQRAAPEGPRPRVLRPLQLHSKASKEEQDLVFKPAPEGERRAIFSTNFAEASVTIDGIVFVVDPGFVKQSSYDAQTGLESLVPRRISQASAAQRMGRAGRTAAGHCYRLYSQETLERFAPAVEPEIHRKNLASVVLHLAAMGIHDVAAFDFLDRPDEASIRAAYAQLGRLGAIDDSGLPTALGRRLAELPLDPELGKLVVLAVDAGCLGEALVIVAMLSTSGPAFMHVQKEEREAAASARESFKSPYGDHVALLQLYQDWLDERSRSGTEGSRRWCEQHFVDERVLLEAWSIWDQLACLIKASGVVIEEQTLSQLPRSPCDAGPSYQEGQCYTAVRQVIMQAYIMNVATVLSEPSVSEKSPKRPSYVTLGGYQSVKIHPSSVLFRSNPEASQPRYVVYHKILRTSGVYMQQCLAIEQAWLLELAPDMYKSRESFVVRKDVECELVQFGSTELLRRAIGRDRRNVASAVGVPGVLRVEVLDRRTGIFVAAKTQEALQQATGLLRRASEDGAHVEKVYALPARFFKDLLPKIGALKRDFSCRLHVDPAQGSDWYDTQVEGHPDDVGALLQRLDDYVRAWEAEEAAAEKVHVEDRYVKMFVGKQRAHVREMEEQTGACVRENRGGQGSTAFFCRGDGAQAEACLALLRQRLEEVRRTCHVEEVVHIDGGLVGLLIGRQGAGIARIKLETQCQIHVDAGGPAGSQAAVHIRGLAENVGRARLRVAAALESRPATPGARSQSWSGAAAAHARRGSAAARSRTPAH